MGDFVPQKIDIPNPGTSHYSEVQVPTPDHSVPPRQEWRLALPYQDKLLELQAHLEERKGNISEERYQIYMGATHIVAQYLEAIAGVNPQNIAKLEEVTAGFIQEHMTVDLNGREDELKKLPFFRVHNQTNPVKRIMTAVNMERVGMSDLEIEIAQRAVATMMMMFGPRREIIMENGGVLTEPLQYFGLSGLENDKELFYHFSASLDYQSRKLLVGGVEVLTDCGVDRNGVKHFRLSRVANFTPGLYKWLATDIRNGLLKEVTDNERVSCFFTARSIGLEKLLEYLYSDKLDLPPNSPERSLMYYALMGALVYGETATGQFPNLLQIIGEIHADPDFYGNVDMLVEELFAQVNGGIESKVEAIRTANSMQRRV